MKRLLYLLLLVPLLGWAEPEGRVRLSVDTEQTHWVGQRVLVHLDLMTNGFSFSGQNFDLPQISGGVLLQTDSSTIKLSETIKGESWQILRYDLSLFSQRAGMQLIPAFDVQFSAGMGYGQSQTKFTLSTEALEVELKMPPGADASLPVVTSPRLTVDEQWQPEQVTFQVGDAVTRVITIEAQDVSAIALPAIPQASIEGIDVLAKAPMVEDQTNRGTLSGRRQEQVSYLFTRAGDYTLPGGSIAWWNPGQERLEAFEFEGREVTIKPDPAAKSLATPALESSGFSLRAIIMLLVLVVLSAALGFAFWPRKKAPADTEPARFKRAIRASRANDAGLAWRQANAWLSMTGQSIAVVDRPVWEVLQGAVVSGDQRWTGHELVNMLKRMRREQLNQVQNSRGVALPSLNPVD